MHCPPTLTLPRRLLSLGIALSLAHSFPALAQQRDDTVEEVVVTGSFIRNSSFNGASPIDVQTQEQLLQTGSVSTGQFMRDLVYTDNVDAVSNVLGGPGGGQDGNTSGFNLRGLGDTSTLTLFDGKRHVNTSEIGSLVPDIALERFETVLDGAAALYGSDAVAGVVNIIPVKSFDGLRFRSSYGRDANADFEEYSAGMLWGGAYGSFDIVASLQYKKNTPLMRYEREKYLRADNDIFRDGPPGTFRRLDSNALLVDPSCGTFGNENNDKGQFDSYPSGIRLSGPVSTAGSCALFFGQWIQFNRPNEQHTFYANVRHETTDWLTLEYQLVADDNLSTFITETTSPMNPRHGPTMVIPANHPANPLGVDMVPVAWRTFNGRSGGTQPSYARGGSQWDDTTILTDRHNFTAYYDIGTEWTGQTAVSLHTRRNRYDTFEEQTSRVRAALQGKGGPNGDLWFNPFFSSDPRSPFYVAGVTDNSQEVVDWLSLLGRTETSRRELFVVDSYITGPVWELPAGDLQVATGIQFRDTHLIERQIYARQFGEDFNAPPGRRDPETTFDSAVRAAFVEFEVPILDSLSAQIAARYEEFTDLNLETTTPKVALRWQPLDDLSLRASWGEGFLAPDPSQVGPIIFNSCAGTRDGEDLLTGTSFIGVDACTTTNPNLGVEESELWNVGFTWEPDFIDGLSVSLDYQEIAYSGRIFTLNNQDIGTQDFLRVLNGIGVTAANFNRTPGSSTWEAARAFVAANPSPNIERDPVTLRPTRIIRTPQNVDRLDVAVYDFKVRYTLPETRLGNFTWNLDASMYDSYLLTEFDGSTREMAGWRNGDTGKAPPLPEVKISTGVSWLRGAHSGRLSSRFTDDVAFGLLDPITRVNPPIFNPGDIVRPTTVEGGWRVDLNYAYQLESLFGFGSGTTLGLTIRNLTDWEPTPLPVQGGFETRLFDPYGRMFTVNLDFEM